MSDRFDVRNITVAQTLDFTSGKPSVLDVGFSIQFKPSANFQATMFATNLDPSSAGNFTDVTSLFSGGAAIIAAGWYRPNPPVMFGSVRVSINSITAAGNVNVAGSFS